MGQKSSNVTDQRELNDKATGPNNVKKWNPEVLDKEREFRSSNTDLYTDTQFDVWLSKATDKTKLKDTGPDSVKKRSHDELNTGGIPRLTYTGAGLSKATYKTKRKGTRPDSVLKSSHDDLSITSTILWDSTGSVHALRKDIARHFKSETDTLDEAERQGVGLRKATDKTKRMDTRPDNMKKSSHEKLDVGGKFRWLSTGMGLRKAKYKMKRKDTRPDSVKISSHDELELRGKFRWLSTDSVQAHASRKYTARQFKSETDSSDEAERQDAWLSQETDKIKLKDNETDSLKKRSHEELNMGRMFCLPSTVDRRLLGYQCLTTLVRRNADVKFAPTHPDELDQAIWSVVHDGVDSPLKKYALIHLSHQLSRQLVGIDKYTNFIVWPGTNLETGKTYFICLHKGPLKHNLKVYFGIKIYYKDSEKLERSMEFPLKTKPQHMESLNYEDASWIQETIEEHGDNLFRHHSNLEAISGNSFATSRTEGLLNCQVVVLYCRVKGFKPYGEDDFPKSLQMGEKSIRVDVREGYFRNGMLGRTDWHEKLCIGISIGVSNDDALAGTLGPFVQLNETDVGFLTCAHVIKPSHLKADERIVEPRELYILQPPNGELLPNQGKSFQEACCGKVIRYIFNPNFQDPTNGLTKNVGVDAALVRVTNRDVDVINFPFIALTDLRKAGFDPKHPPVFKHHSCKYPLEFKKVQGKRVIKYGRSTGLTKGSMLLDGAMVKVHDSELELPSKKTVVMKGQYIVEKHGSTAFFDLGDSGSGVFMLDKENKLTCIGLAIGVLDEQHDLQCVVAPIEYVLKALGLSLDSLKIHEKMDIGE